MKELQFSKFWIFDLDNTLYSGKSRVFEQIDKRMSKYISGKLNVSIVEAKEIQKKYFYKYNTTLNGMLKNHKIDANEFLEFVHDIDIDFLKKDLTLSEELRKLKGKKIIFTNGSKKHALNVIRKIGIEQHFDDIFDIVDSNFVPKPTMEPYKKLVEKHKIDPNLCVLIEDIARNLKIGASVLCPGFVNTNITDSERNRPQHLKVKEQPEMDQQAMEMFNLLLKQGKEPSEIAEIVLNSIKENVFYILPHPAWDDNLRNHFEAILSRKELVPPSANDMADFFKPREDGEKY